MRTVVLVASLSVALLSLVAAINGQLVGGANEAAVGNSEGVQTLNKGSLGVRSSNRNGVRAGLNAGRNKGRRARRRNRAGAQVFANKKDHANYDEKEALTESNKIQLALNVENKKSQAKAISYNAGSAAAAGAQLFEEQEEEGEEVANEHLQAEEEAVDDNQFALDGMQDNRFQAFGNQFGQQRGNFQGANGIGTFGGGGIGGPMGSYQFQPLFRRR